MADDFTERYGNLLTGSYDCVDRVVLNDSAPVAAGTLAEAMTRRTSNSGAM